MSRYRFAALTSLLLATLWSLPVHGQEQTDEGVMVFLVRHAERADDGADTPHQADPSLSAAGRTRAELLASLLRDAGITRIHSTDYARTKETASPVAALTGVPVSTYDPNELAAFAEVLRTQPGRHLVVGHSNTTWDLVLALGGDPGEPIEALEYDRLYLLSIGAAGTRTVLLRFGAPHQR